MATEPTVPETLTSYNDRVPHDMRYCRLRPRPYLRDEKPGIMVGDGGSAEALRRPKGSWARVSGCPRLAPDCSANLGHKTV